jgi:membrane fusion protein, multidrug efflux system
MRFLGRRASVFILVIIVLGVAAGGIWLRIGRSAHAQSAGEDDGAPDSAALPASAASAFNTEMPIPVEGARVVRDTLVVSVTAAAQAEAQRSVQLRAQVGGQVGAVPVAEGDRVGAGALLVRVDSEEYVLDVRKAQAAVEQAQAAYRQKTLFDGQIADSSVRAERERVARAQSGLLSAQVELDQARLTLAETEVRAPFGGAVASLQVAPGQRVSKGDELVTVEELDPIRVEVQVLEGEVGYLKPGADAKVTFAAFPSMTFDGRVSTINPQVSQDTRTARVTVVVPNPDGRVLPGMYARVALDAQRFPDRILVPRSAILERDRRTMLFVFAPQPGEGNVGLAKWRYVTTGLENDSLVEIVPNAETEMVKPGEIVLTAGHYTLIHDARVQLVTSADSLGRPN